MNRVITLPAIALVATIALAACSSGATGAVGGASASPLPPSAPASSAVPTPGQPSEQPTAPSPSATPATSSPTTVALENVTGHAVTIELLDESGRIVAARSGHPADGVSVEFGSVRARNLDARTVELTWSDTPGDAQLGLYVNEAASVVLVIRPERPEGDAIAFDRVLVVEFDAPVDAASLTLGVQEGLDTAS